MSDPALPAGQTAAGIASPDPDPLLEVVVGSRSIHRGRYLDFHIDTVERLDGSRHDREVVGHPGAIAVVAVDADDRVLLVRQWRLPAGGALLEIPAGTLDRHPDGSVEDPGRAAPRELEEETGQRAGRWEHLGSFWTAPGFATELMHLYLATDLSPVGDGRLGPDEDEALELHRLPLDEAVEQALRGELRDAKTILGVLWAAHRLGR